MTDYINKYLNLTLSTTPLSTHNIKLAKQAAIELYKVLNLKPPTKFDIVDSPKHVYDKYKNYSEFSNQLRDQLDNQLSNQPYNKLNKLNKLNNQLWNQLYIQLWNQLYDQLYNQLWIQLYQLYNQLWIQRWFICYAAMLDYTINELNKTEFTKYQPLITLIQNCPFFFYTNNTFIIQHKPTQLHYNNQNQLHNTTGPALLYKDGCSLYSYNGRTVDKELITEPQTLLKIKNEQNIELRRIRIELYGWLNYLKDSNATVVDERHNEVENTREALLESGEDTVLVVTCKTGRIFALPVQRNIRTCIDAQNWLSGNRGLVSICRT